MADPKTKLDPEELLAHREFVQSLARRLVLDPHQADDISQEALLAALCNPPPRRGSLRAWLASVVRNLAFRTFRADTRRRRREARRARPEWTPSTGDVVADLQLHREVVDALLSLDEPFRTTLVRHFFEGLAPCDIARLTATSQATVRSRLKRGIERLRSRLDERHGGRATWILALLSLAFPTRVEAGATATGVALMSTKAKVSLAAVALLIAGGVTTSLLLGSADTGDDQLGRAVPRESTRSTKNEAIDREADVSTARAVDWSTLADRDLDVFGLVVNTDGAPVPGAQIQAVRYPWRRTLVLGVDRELIELLARTVSASDGSFVLRLRRGMLVSLSVAADGYAKTEYGGLQAGERVRVVLAAGRMLRVRVRDSSGGAVIGAMVRVRADGDVSILREAQTNAAGETAFTNLPGGDDVRVSVNAFHAAYGKTWGKNDLRVGGEVEIVLPGGRFFEGRITDAETGAPVVGARVGMHHRMRPFTLTDTDGRYRINGWMGPRVSHGIHVVGRNYVRTAREVGLETEYDFELVRGTAASGRVVDTQAKPIENVRVAVVGSGDPEYTTANTRSGRDGRFRMTALNPKLVHTLIVQAEGYGRTLLDFSPQEDIELGDIVLGPGHSIEGRLLDTEDKPVARRPVQLVGANADRRRLGVRPRVDVYGNQEGRLTDDLGRFRFPDLAPGRYKLEVRREGGPRLMRDVQLKDADVRDVVLRLAEGRPFTVWVHDDAGQPVSNASVNLESGGGRAWLVTDADGKAVFTVHGPVKLVHAPTVHAPKGSKWGPAYRPLPRLRELKPDATEARFVLQRWDEIRGRVLGVDGKPVERVELDAFHGGRRVHRTYTDIAGEFRVVVPPRSNVELRVAGRLMKFRGVYTQDKTVTAEAVRASAGQREVLIRLRRIEHNRTLRVRVMTPDGRPIVDARVSVTAGGPPQQSIMTDLAGRALLQGLPSSGATITVSMPSGSEFAPPRQQTVDPEGQDLVMRARKAIKVTGRVLTDAGQPASGVQVLARSGTQGLTALTGADGRFHLLLPADEKSFDLLAIQRVGNNLCAQAIREGYRPADGEAILHLKKIG